MKTRIERSQQASVLGLWVGARAQIWIFDVSLRRMALRIYRPQEPELIYVTAVGCAHLTGPFDWDNAAIEIHREPPNAEHPASCRIVDKSAGFELLCSDADVVKGPSTDYEKTFDNFMNA